MSTLTDRLLERMFPSRHWINFRNATIFVLTLTAIATPVHLFLHSRPRNLPPQYIQQQIFRQDVLRSPLFLVLYNAAVAIVFFVIYASRHNTRYYSMRVFIYAMFLAGVINELLYFIFPPSIIH